MDYTIQVFDIKKNLVSKHWHLINDIPGCAQTPFIGWRKTRSIGDKLIRSDMLSIAKRDLPITGH